MNDKLIKYRITPRVFSTGKEVTLTVEGLDESTLLYDDLTYTAKIFCHEDWKYREGKELYGRSQVTHEVTVSPRDGVITLSHIFPTEGVYQIEITRERSEKHLPERYEKYGWMWRIEATYQPVSFLVYALGEDLYGTRPFKGDLHMHSYHSDGEESPAMVAAQMRKAGYDFICLTDHYAYEPSLVAQRAIADVPTRMTVFAGEEVHPIYGAVFHVVNFGGRASVNERAYGDPEKMEREAAVIAEELTEVADPIDRSELAHFIWIARAIKEVGGLAIYPHPYWVFGAGLNVRHAISEWLLKKGIFDAYEVLGGTDELHNKQQVQLYYELRADGVRIPIVGSTDAHSALGRGWGTFDNHFTVVLASDVANIPDAIRAGRSVAVDNKDTAHRGVYGEMRYVRYASFLLEHYYPLHDEAANAAGQALLRYVQGDKTQSTLIGLLEEQTRKIDRDFFGEATV